MFRIFLYRCFHLTVANVSYLKIFSFTCSIHLLRKIPNSISNYLPSCMTKFVSLSFSFNFVLSKLSMLSCVFVLTQLVEKKTTFIWAKITRLFSLWQFLSAEDLAHDVNYWVYQCVLDDFFSPLFIWKWNKIFALKGGTISKCLKYCLHREYFVKITCSCRC